MEIVGLSLNAFARHYLPSWKLLLILLFFFWITLECLLLLLIFMFSIFYVCFFKVVSSQSSRYEMFLRNYIYIYIKTEIKFKPIIKLKLCIRI